MIFVILMGIFHLFSIGFKFLNDQHGLHVVDASRFLLQEITQYFHSAYLLILQQIYRISSEIVCNALAARTSALVWWCLEVGAEREAR
jgi:hypothetical protein